jgi:hypothetical protein
MRILAEHWRVLEATRREQALLILEIYRASGTTILQKILTESRARAHLADAVVTEDTVLYAYGSTRTD